LEIYYPSFGGRSSLTHNITASDTLELFISFSVTSSGRLLTSTATHHSTTLQVAVTDTDVTVDIVHDTFIQANVTQQYYSLQDNVHTLSVRFVVLTV